jgi:protein TonB
MQLDKPAPIYPEEARAAGVQGAVILHAIISKTGTIEDLSVISGPELLQAAAADAVQRWTYRPYLLNGEPTGVRRILR